MKKIGILTYWGVPNYGAWTQAYALNNIVKELSGNDSEVVHLNYLSKIHWNSYYENDIQLCNAFTYSWEEIEHSNIMTENELEEKKYDILITGSDSIWEFSHSQMGNDIHLIGNKLNAEKIISYAASFGETNREDLEKWVADGLRNYSLITVRDYHSKKIVKELLGNVKCEIVLDPSLLYDFVNDSKVKEPVYKKYIVVYGVVFDDEFVSDTIKLAHDNGLELISVGYINKWCDRSIKMLELRTFEWLGFFKNAEYVVTSMFHGLMVGLSFHKQVKFNQVQYVKNRSQTLLELLNIEDEVSDFNSVINYDDVNILLTEMRNKSYDILRKELRND